MKLKKITLQDKKIFSQYLGLSRKDLSVYHFSNIYIWKKLFAVSWKIINESLCVFFQDKLGCFLYFSPQGKEINPETIFEVFRIMDGFNSNPAVSRIENIAEEDIVFYQDSGYLCRQKPGDYLCRRADLASLTGNKFKSKRACVNYFLKNNEFEYAPFSLKYRAECLDLHDCWVRERKSRNPDSVYRGMLEDSRNCLAITLADYAGLDLIGRVVKIGGKIKAFTLGYKLNSETFCILYEIAGLSVKGLAQFIFREFCRESAEYKYINIMDDSGLENLKKVKLSYQPIKLIPSYIATRRDA